MTMDTTWTLLLDDGRGGWMFCDQMEYGTEREVHDLAGRMYGGTVSYRVVRIDRTVVDEVIR